MTRTELRARFGCVVDPQCERVDSYMVHDHVWSEAGFTRKQCACLPHLELRLRRSLTIDDFTEKPINDPIRFGFMMALRGAAAT